ncbi:unnamed protein product [Protopolystoma xenopodis]|uniref:Uncharacterized protein n=1 Tax=Protopolystoma xenopodis TaxID=117903 RepID=A0A3S5B8G3_9PLAT|nr:unnamed protein product [Protopolystoma xenopodis]
MRLEQRRIVTQVVRRIFCPALRGLLEHGLIERLASSSSDGASSGQPVARRFSSVASLILPLTGCLSLNRTSETSVNSTYDDSPYDTEEPSFSAVLSRRNASRKNRQPDNVGPVSGAAKTWRQPNQNHHIEKNTDKFKDELETSLGSIEPRNGSMLVQTVAIGGGVFLPSSRGPHIWQIFLKFYEMKVITYN